MLVLQLAELPATLAGPDDRDYKGRLPARARFLHPTAADALVALESATPMVYTDVFRSAEASLAAKRAKAGVQPPGYSGHNYGLSVDLDVGACLKRHGIRYPELVEAMGRYGWYCHRQDLDATASEAWHFNCLLPEPGRYLAYSNPRAHQTWSAPVERRILDLYGDDFALHITDVQALLKTLKLYAGEVDGDAGPLTREAVRVFQRAWGLAEDGAPGPTTQRVLAYVAAARHMETRQWTA